MTNRHSEAAVPAGEEPALPQEDKTPPEEALDEKHTRRRRKGSWGNTINWNDEECLCTECAPRAAVAMTSARANRLVEEIEEKAAASTYLKEEVTRKQTFCPECGKPVGETKFCTNCGANLALDSCPKCGVSNQPGTRFCGGCGTRLE